MQQTSKKKREQYRHKVFGFLRRVDGVSTREKIAEKLELPGWYIDQMTSSEEPFYTSLNCDRKYIASKHKVGNRAGPDGFWRTNIDHNEVVFHRKGKAKATLKKLAFNKPWGITVEEANDLLGRKCYRALSQLAEKDEVGTVEIKGTLVYTHISEEKQNLQIKERQTNEKVEIENEEPEDGHIFSWEILDDFVHYADKNIDSIDPYRSATVLLKRIMDDSYDGAETRIRNHPKLMNTLRYDNKSDVPDSSTICRDVDRLELDELENCLTSMIDYLIDETDNAGKYEIVDATHIHAWINTRQNVENDDIEGATWGLHEDWFYGYKLYLLIDAVLELPIAVLLTTGKQNDQEMFIPLIDKFKEQYDLDEIQAVFGDAGFDSVDNKKKCEKKLDCPFMTAINPRRSKQLKAIKEKIKEIFKEHGDEINNVKDALERLPQKLLTEFGVEIGNYKESYIIHAIKERMNRHLRAGVERVISRLKEFTSLDKPKTRDEKKVRKHAYLSVLAMVALAVSAKEREKTSLMRSFSKII